MLEMAVFFEAPSRSAPPGAVKKKSRAERYPTLRRLHIVGMEHWFRRFWFLATDS